MHPLGAILALSILASILTVSSAARAADDSAAGAAAAEPASYRLGPGDKLKVVIYGEEAISGEYLVDDLGRVSLPLIGEVAAGGSTVTDLQNAITKALADGFLRDPRVSVEVENYRPYFILGEVAKPGEYPYVAGLTVTNAAATAGGFTYRANTHKVLIRHANDTKEATVNLTGQTPVLPGDTIKVPERFF
jgi:protein involved in polysaccharide export with SLBB domain